jgi:ketosteroid isomerase-like protein
MDRSDVERWLDRYVEAWGSNDPKAIGDLFTEGARYFTAPHRPPWEGRQAIVEGWLDRKEDPETWRFRYEVLGVDGNLGFVRGWADYFTEDTDYSTLWVIRLEDDGRCSEFIEWWVPIEKKS